MAVPNLFVNDYAGVLSVNQETSLENKIRAHESESSNQIAIVTLKHLEGYDPGDLAHRIAEKWGLGQKEHDNGILILVKPKYPGSRGKVYIAVGYGLEHVVTDGLASRIVKQQLIPNFKRNRYYEGLDQALDQIISLSRGEYVNENRYLISDKYVLNFILIGISILLLPIIYLVYLRFRKVSVKYSSMYIHGEYNLENLLDQVEEIEKQNDAKYSKFKRQLRHYNLISKKHMVKYSDKIDRRIFCYLLNGEKRYKAFFRWADPVLYIMAGYLLIIQFVITYSVLVNVGVAEFIFANALSLVFIYTLFNFLVSFLEIFLFSLRSKSKYTGGVAVALFALYAIFKRGIKRKYVPGANSYIYYPHVSYTSGSYGGGSFGGGFGGGGFGGGSFGGGGAGGGW